MRENYIPTLTPHTKALSALKITGRLSIIAIAYFCLCTSSKAQDADSGSSDKTVAVNNALNAIEEGAPQANPASSERTVNLSAIEVYPPAGSSSPASSSGATPSSQAAPSSPTASSSASTSSGNTFKVTGEVRAAMGIDAGGNLIFDKANADLDERNWRLISTAGPNNGINTYDEAIYSRIKTVLDGSVASGVVSFHLNVTVDPWSFTGKSNTMHINSEGDAVNIQYLTWGNSGYTIPEVVGTLNDGDGLYLPEVKIHGNSVPATTVNPLYTFFNFNTWNIPTAQLTYSFNPIREAWVDIKPDNDLKLRIFPMAYQDQAMSTDDPFQLSNHTEWWAESPWIDGWQPGNLNTNTNPVSYTIGQWDKSLSFSTEDSDFQRLTALRGVSLVWTPDDETSLNAEIASPKTLWQDYGEVTTVPASVRLKQYFGDNFYMGALTNMHLGYTEGEDLDAENYTGGVDAGYMPIKGIKLSAEYAKSDSMYNVSSPGYEINYGGNAYYVALESASNPDDEDLLRKNYYAFQPLDEKQDFFKTKIFYARMDQGFESSLSDYNWTSHDSFWADHLSFYPSDYSLMPGLAPPTQSEGDYSQFAVGDGINYGQSTVTWRADENLMEGKLQGFEDIRHVMDNYGNNLENAYRTQWTLKATDRLTAKALLLWDSFPNTTPGVDPFLIYDQTGQSFFSNAVQGNQDPSVQTASLGAQYVLTDWATVNGVWEYTNNSVMGENFDPEQSFTQLSNAQVQINGKNYIIPYPNIFDAGSFDQAPYDYYNIFKAGLELKPADKWHIYLDYTRNPNQFTPNIDDNINHVGIETAYIPTPKLGFFVRYRYATGYNINDLNQDNNLDQRHYNNIFFETRMILPKDITMSLEYGVGPYFNLQTSSSNPSLAYYTSLVYETQHIIRIVFDKKF